VITTDILNNVFGGVDKLVLGIFITRGRRNGAQLLEDLQQPVSPG
jgi:hypothetical protein